MTTATAEAERNEEDDRPRKKHRSRREAQVMRALWPVLPHAGDETPVSLMSRLALLHGRSPRDFCRDMGQSFQGIVDGCRAALAAFAGLVRMPVEGLEENAVRKVAERRFEWRGETFTRDVLARASVRVCPACLAEDVAAATEWPEHAPYGRTLWTLEPLRACPVHGVGLVTLGKTSTPGALHDVASAIAPHVAGLGVLAAEAKPVSSSDMEDYLLDRLAEGAVGGGWLDGLSWHAAADACQTVGAVALHGPDVRLKELDETDWRMAGDAGHAIAADGEAGIRDLLADLDAAYMGSRASVDGPQARYGALFRRLAGTLAEADFDPLRDVVFRHVVETTPVGPGDSLFGRPIGRRILHSVRSASVEYGIHPKRLRKILLAKAIITVASDVTDERAVFAANDATLALLRKASESVSLTEAETYLGAGRVHAKLLVENGFIEPFVRLPAETFGEMNFAKGDLDAFLAKLLNGGRDGRRRCRRTPSTSRRRPSARTAAPPKIIRLVVGTEAAMDGAAQRASKATCRCWSTLAEIKGLVHGGKRDGFTARELETRLRTTTKVIAALIKHGELPTSEINNPINRCPTRIVLPADVDAFEAEFASLNGVADEWGRHFKAVKSELAALGIEPTLTRDVYSASFYRRADLPTA